MKHVLPAERLLEITEPYHRILTRILDRLQIFVGTRLLEINRLLT